MQSIKKIAGQQKPVCIGLALLLMDAWDGILGATPEHFPADFSEFLINMSVNDDVMYYRTDTTPRAQPQTFDTTFSNRYNLRVQPLVKTQMGR